jgi:hypothetical protein
METVQTVEELDTVLDRIERQRGTDGLPFVVDITDDREFVGFPVGLHMSIGGQHRAKVFWNGTPAGGSGIGVEPGVSPWDGEPIAFDYGGMPTEETPDTLRVTPKAARQAAREFIETGQRPTCLTWE